MRRRVMMILAGAALAGSLLATMHRHAEAQDTRAGLAEVTSLA
jgi:hypothetical protein